MFLVLVSRSADFVLLQTAYQPSILHSSSSYSMYTITEAAHDPKVVSARRVAWLVSSDRPGSHDAAGIVGIDGPSSHTSMDARPRRLD